MEKELKITPTSRVIYSHSGASEKLTHLIERIAHAIIGEFEGLRLFVVVMDDNSSTQLHGDFETPEGEAVRITDGELNDMQKIAESVVGSEH